MPPRSQVPPCLSPEGGFEVTVEACKLLRGRGCGPACAEPTIKAVAAAEDLGGCHALCSDYSIVLQRIQRPGECFCATC